MEQAQKQRFRTMLQDQIANQISLAGANATDDNIKEMIKQTVQSTLERVGDTSQDEIDEIVVDFINEFLYFGPLMPLLQDDTISEIMVNGGGFDENNNPLPHIVEIERDGIISRVDDVLFDDDAHVRRIMNRICSRQGRRIDDANPIEDATLPDGSRFNGTVYPVAPDGSTFNIRKFKNDMLTAEQLVEGGTATQDEMDFLASAVASRCSILISGGTGSGKTTTLNILGTFIPMPTRIITIEDTTELQLHKKLGLENVLRFEARKPNTEGAGEVTLDDHLRAALRKRPDRIIIGECRGAEAYTMLEAMNTGHEGSMTTIHANDPVSALTRLVTLVKQGDATLSEDTIKQKIASALDLVIQVNRLSDGRRVITAIETIGGFVDGNIQHDRIFEFEQTGVDAHTKEVLGRHRKCNSQPAAIRDKIQAAGFAYDLNWFIDSDSSRVRMF